MFSLGICSVIGPIFMILIYLTRRLFTMFGSYLERKEGPKDRVLWYIFLFGLFGFIVGCLAQPHWDALYGCYQSTGVWESCLLPFKK